MTEVVGVRFRQSGKVYYFDPGEIRAEIGDKLIVETARGIEMGETAQRNHKVADEGLELPLKRVLRKATAEDLAAVEANRKKEREAMDVFRKKIASHKLDMEPVDVAYSFDSSKIVFYFISEGRVDFRELVKDLAGIFRTRIELRQIGVRDEAKLLGGLGICGRPFCCSQFLDEFIPVSIKMAKTQNLSLNPTKISGTCGRLMCCLKYEQEAYEDLVKHSTKMDSFVETPDGVGTVSSVNLLRQKVNVRLENDPDSPHCYHNCEVCVVRSGKGKRPEGYVAPPPEELAKLRKTPDRNEETSAQVPEGRLGAALEQVLGGQNRTPEQQPDREPGEEHRRRNRRRNRGGSKPGAEGGAPTEQAQAQPRQQAPAKKEGEQKAEGGEKKPGRHRNRHRHRRPKSEGGAPAQN